MNTPASGLTEWFDERRTLVEESVMSVLEDFSFPEMSSGLVMELHCQALMLAAARVRKAHALLPGTSSVTAPFGGYGESSRGVSDETAPRKPRRGRGSGRSRARKAPEALDSGSLFPLTDEAKAPANGEDARSLESSDGTFTDP